MKEAFPSDKLLSWFTQNKRPLPWRQHYDPYHVWISEVMAQQTRMDQLLPYYVKFLKQFPTVKVLADADEQSVLKAWEGLGYYSRARNLHHAAKQVANEKKGNIPHTKKELQELKGFGPYISSAVASIAFNENEVVVDGNVFRVMSRFWGDSQDVSLPKTRNAFEEKLHTILPRGKAREFNQALMELGALVCSPDNPNCNECPLQNACYAFAYGKQSEFPVKTKKIKPPIRHFMAVRVEQKGKLLLFKRKQKLLHGMFEFPMVEYNPLTDNLEKIEKKFSEEFGITLKLGKSNGEARHQYSHFTQHVHMVNASIVQHTSPLSWVQVEEVKSLPLSRVQQKLMN